MKCTNSEKDTSYQKWLEKKCIIWIVLTSKQTGLIIYKLPTKKSPDLKGTAIELHQTFKGELSPIYKLFPKNVLGGNTSQRHSLRQVFYLLTNQTKTSLKTKNYRPLQVKTTKSSTNILAKQIPQHVKRIIQHEQAGFIPGIQGWFNIHKGITPFQKNKKGITPFQKNKGQTHLIASTGAKKKKKHLAKPNTLSWEKLKCFYEQIIIRREFPQLDKGHLRKIHS